jgi:hypothetical protein
MHKRLPFCNHDGLNILYDELFKMVKIWKFASTSQIYKNIHEMVYDNFYVHIVHKHLLMLNKQHNEESNEHVEFYLNLILVPLKKKDKL